MFSNLFQQIKFCVTINAFENQDFVEKLLIDIEQLIESLKKIASEGQRHSRQENKKVDLKIYLNEFGSHQNIIIHEGDRYKSTFLGFDYPHYIVTESEDFYKYAQTWIDKIRQKSVLISAEAFKDRELYFQNLETKFKQFKLDIQTSLQGLPQ